AQNIARSGLPMFLREVVTDTGISLEAVTGTPSADTKRQANTSPAKRLAIRKGSSAPKRAIIEKRGNSTKATSRLAMKATIKHKPMAEKLKPGTRTVLQ